MTDHQIKIPETEKKRVIIVGGGFGGMKLAKKLRSKDLQVVMFDRHNYHTFQPLLYQVATAALEPDSIAGPLRKMLENNKDFYFRMAEVTGLDPDQQEVVTVMGRLKYDYLVLAFGTVTNYFGNQDIEQKSFPLKQVPHALNLRSYILQNFENAVFKNDEKEIQKLMNFVIVGGGPTGVEVAGALGELKLHVLPRDYPDLNFKRMEIFLIEGQSRLLPAMSISSSERAYKYLKKFDVNVQIEKFVKDYDGEKVTLSDGLTIPTKTLVWAAGVTGSKIEGIPEEVLQRGRILVNEYNQVRGFDNIFAIGDIAMMKTDLLTDGHPQLAPVAMQQGELLGKNLIKVNNGQKAEKFKYHHKGSMATIGRNRAVVDLPGKVHFGGLLAWITWMFVHLLQLIGFRNKLVVFSNWAWNYFTYDRGTRLIIRPFHRKEAPKEVKKTESVVS